MPMYRFKIKAQGVLVSEQETVSPETKPRRIRQASDPDVRLSAYSTK